jgi:putative membrane protein
MRFEFDLTPPKVPFLIKLIISTFSVFLASYLTRGVLIDNFITALLVAFVLAIFNVTLKPLLVLLTLPITLFSFGLFLFVVNALLVLLAGHLIDGFEVASFWSAVWFSLMMSIINFFLQNIGPNKPKPPQRIDY